MLKSDLILLAIDEAKKALLDPFLIQAIITAESNWDPSTIRCEINVLPVVDAILKAVPLDVFRYTISPRDFANQNGISLNTEITLQKSSFGLMQLMGHNFREFGYAGLLTKTFDPEINLMFGCKFFKARCDKYEVIDDKVASYNAGTPKKTVDGKYTNQDYVNKVVGLYNRLSRGSPV